MPKTIRRLIIENVQSKLDEIVELVGSTEVNAPDQIDLETASLPKAYIDSNMDDENVEEHDTSHEAFSFKPIISVYFKVQDTKNNFEGEDFLGLVHAKLTEDRHRGGYADETKRLTADIVEIESQNQQLIQGLVMIWEIEYTHLKDDPYNQ